MSILDNERVRKYFQCDRGHCPKWHKDQIEPDYLECMALRVLQAMEEPIKKGEKYLDLSNADYREKNHLGQLPAMIADGDLEETHFGFLRLPDRFQPLPEGEKEDGFFCPSCEHCRQLDLQETFEHKPKKFVKCKHCGHRTKPENEDRCPQNSEAPSAVEEQIKDILIANYDLNPRNGDIVYWIRERLEAKLWELAKMVREEK